MNINKSIEKMNNSELAAYRKYLIYHANGEMTFEKRRGELQKVTSQLSKLKAQS